MITKRLDLITIKIDGELPDLNTDIGLIRSHKMAYSNHKSDWTNYCKLQIQSQINKSKLKIDTSYFPLVPVFIWITRNLKMDCDNITFAKKYILDGMKLAKLIPDDSRQYIAGFGGDFFRVANNETPNVKIILFSKVDFNFGNDYDFFQ